MTNNIYVGANANTVASFLKKAAEKTSHFKETPGRFYYILSENKYFTEFIDVRHNGNTITQIGYCEFITPEGKKLAEVDMNSTWQFIHAKIKEMGLIDINMDEL